MSESEENNSIDEEEEKKEEFKFTYEPAIYLRELKGYKTKANYRFLFDTLPDDVKEDLIKQTEYLHSLFSRSIMEPYSYYPEYVRNICDIPVVLEIFKKSHLNKMLLNVGFILSYDTVNSRPIQVLQYSFVSSKFLKNIIYNVLFHAYICINYFEHSKLFQYFYYKDDIKEMTDIRMRELRLFGSIQDMECCVCFDKTIIKTVCNHNLCDKCFLKIKNRLCPICRGSLDINVDDDDIDSIDIIIQRS